MSEKSIGNMGQRYEDRKTKKEGILYSRDEENKRLEMMDDNGDKFFISYSAFKSNWRKSEKADIVELEDAKIVNANKDSEPAKIYENDLSEFDIKADNDDSAKVFDSGVEIANITKDGKNYLVKAIPEMYVGTDWDDIIVPNTMKFQRHCPVTTSLSFVVTATIEEILNRVKEATKVTNSKLYKKEKEA